MDSMDYLDAAMAVVEAQAPVQDRSSTRPPWLKSFSFENGTFPIRFVSDAEKCPRGFHPHCKHAVQVKAIPNRKMTNEEKASYYNEILCTLSTHGTVPIHNDEGKVVGSRLAQPCPVCDVGVDLCRSFGQYDTPSGEWSESLPNAKFLGIPETKLDAGIQAALEDMRQGYCLSYLFPCLVRASVGKNKDGFDAYSEGGSVFLAILELKPGRYASDKEMLQKINAIRKEHPDMFSRGAEGRWLSYTTKKRNKDMAAEEPSALSDSELALLKKYPNVVDYGKGADHIPGSDKRYTYDQALDCFNNSWWMKSIRRKYPTYSVDNIEMGLV